MLLCDVGTTAPASNQLFKKVRQRFMMSISHNGVPIETQQSFQSSFLVNVPRRQQTMTQVHGPLLPRNVEDRGGVPSSWLWPGQHQLCQAFEGLNQGIQELFLSVSLPVSKIKDKIKIDYTVFQLEHSRKQSDFLRLGFFFICGSSLHMPAFRIQGLTV